MATTSIVVTSVSRRVGHVTFAASARTCCKYSNGLVLAISSDANAKPLCLRRNSVKLRCPIVPNIPPTLKWQEWRDSNPQPPVLETGALAD
jgi:hypothetical protein